jgi:hypothetical protein
MAAFTIFSLRFERVVDGRVVIEDLQPVTAPVMPGADWDRGRDAGPIVAGAPAACVVVIAPGTTTLVVKARFFEMPSNQRFEIRAADRTCGSVLPHVEPIRTDEKLPGCVSREFTFEVDATRMARHGVGRHEICWQWTARNLLDGEGQPRDLGVTRFVVFAILGSPAAAPWRSASSEDGNRDLLHRDVLDVACRAADGAANARDAGAGVTRAFFDLGSDNRRQSGRRLFVYGDTDDFICDEEHHVFLCRRFVDALGAPDTGRPIAISCEDLATAVCVFGNALGLDLERRYLANPAADLHLNRVKLIGERIATGLAWDHHVVAWQPGTEGVFDACVQLNMAVEGEPDRWETPAGIPFGAAEPTPGAPPGYRHRLLERDAKECETAALRDPILDRASSDRGDVAGPIERLQQHYHQALFELAPPARPLASVSFPLPLARLNAPPGFDVFDDGGREDAEITVASWQAMDTPRRRVRLTAEWAPGRDAAIALAAWRLTFCRERMRTTPADGFRDALYLSTADGQRALLLFQNAVVRLRSDGPDAVDLATLFTHVLDPVLVPPA